MKATTDPALSEERQAKAEEFLQWAERTGMRRLVYNVRHGSLTPAWLAYLRCALARYRWAKGERQA